MIKSSYNPFGEQSIKAIVYMSKQTVTASLFFRSDVRVPTCPASCRWNSLFVRVVRQE